MLVSVCDFPRDTGDTGVARTLLFGFSCHHRTVGPEGWLSWQRLQHLPFLRLCKAHVLPFIAAKPSQYCLRLSPGVIQGCITHQTRFIFAQFTGMLSFSLCLPMVYMHGNSGTSHHVGSGAKIRSVSLSTVFPSCMYTFPSGLYIGLACGNVTLC